MEFSEDIKKLLKDKYPDKDICKMSLGELKLFREEIENLREEYSLIELGAKTLSNSLYGASANKWFYFYNLALAGDITAECRQLTKTMWYKLEDFFHNEIWERKDLWEKFNFELDPNKRKTLTDSYTSIYSDTDSVYITLGDLFKCMTPEYQKLYDTDRKKIDWLVKFSKEFIDKQNKEWLDAMYNPRGGQNVHEFELETISRAGIFLKKKKYLKALSFVKGKYYDKPKLSGTGIEIIKSTTPKLCRVMLKQLTEDLLFNAGNMTKDEYVLYFNDLLTQKKKEFYNAPVEDVSQSVGVGAYKKYVIDDTRDLVFAKKCPVSVKAIARYNYLAAQNGDGDKRVTGGKIKYYNIRLSNGEGEYFGFPAGELPRWAPPMDKATQWRKNIIEPINRFLTVMGIPEMNEQGVIQMSLFGF